MLLDDENYQAGKEIPNPFDQLARDFKLMDGETARTIDHEFRAALGKLTQGMSPIELFNAYTDWLGHLAISPGKQLHLLQSAVHKVFQLGKFTFDAVAHGAETENIYTDRSFAGDAWQQFPYSFFAQSFLATKEFIKESSENVFGVKGDHEELVSFMNTQIIEAISPANIPFTNPDIVAATKAEHGQNIADGLKRMVDDLTDRTPVEERNPFQVGKDVGKTPGKVIFQNRLIELIQYTPTTPEVGSDPVLIIPPWIMKFYILDLTPKQSLIKYLVDQGKTVFIVSWKNPTAEDRDLTMDDYLDLGLLEALKAVTTIVPRCKVNTVGYCIGGTLLAIGAAALARDGDDTIKSVSLFTAQTDFTEPGEIKRMLGESQVSFVESAMWKQGYLEATNMGGAFKAMKPADLVWGPRVNRYFLGKEAEPNELMAWSEDATRMPYRMHTDYLRQLYLSNDLAVGEYKVHGEPVSLADIRVPIFAVGTTTDHVAPWKSVYKILRLTHTPVTFLLTNGGHNAGIICGAEHPRRSYQVHLHHPGDSFIDPDTWSKTIEKNPGSWWLEWNDWLDVQSGNKIKAPKMGAAKKGYEVLRDAPGEYVIAP